MNRVAYLRNISQPTIVCYHFLAMFDYSGGRGKTRKKTFFHPSPSSPSTLTCNKWLMRLNTPLPTSPFSKPFFVGITIRKEMETTNGSRSVWLNSLLYPTPLLHHSVCVSPSHYFFSSPLQTWAYAFFLLIFKPFRNRKHTHTHTFLTSHFTMTTVIFHIILNETKITKKYIKKISD